MAFGSRQRKCIIKSCRQPFKPISMTHKCCSAPCAAEYAKEVRVKKEAQEARLKTRREAEEKREHRKKVEKLKTRQDWLKDAQAVFNRYIRERDAEEACISCGARGRESWDAGHYRSVGAAPQLRFHEDNCHKQCVPCNQFRSGNAIEYRLGLLQRIGTARLEFLESHNVSSHLSIEDIKQVMENYRNKLKELKKERE